MEWLRLLGLRRWAVLLCVLALAACSSGGGVDGDDDDDDDDNGDTHYPPAAITNLRVVDSSMVTIKLKWTVPDSNAAHDRARQYDLRFGAVPITPANWSQMAPWFGAPLPGQPGADDSVVIGGLSADTRYYFAIDCNNLFDQWSGLSNVAAARTLNDLVVHFPDTALESAIRALIAKPVGDIQGSELRGYTELRAEHRGIHDLTGIGYCADLVFLHVSENEISDLSPVASLPALAVLGLRDNHAADLSPLAGMTTLQQLILPGNGIVDLAPLANLPNLTVLYLHSNQITDLAPLVANQGVGQGDLLTVSFNPLTQQALTVQIPALVARGVTVQN